MHQVAIYKAGRRKFRNPLFADVLGVVYAVVVSCIVAIMSLYGLLGPCLVAAFYAFVFGFFVRMFCAEPDAEYPHRESLQKRKRSLSPIFGVGAL